MSIFFQLPKEQIHKDFTHVGWMNLCPIYADMRNDDCPTICERNWIPGWWLDFNGWLHQFTNWMGEMLIPNFEPAEFVFVLEPLNAEEQWD